MAIYRFYDVTYEITDQEVKEAEFLAERWNTSPHKHEHMNASSLVASFKKGGITISEVRLRKIINFIRLNNLIIGLCSDSRGYWIARNASELKDTLISLNDRLAMQTATYNTLYNQYKKMTDGETNIEDTKPSKEIPLF